MSITVVIPTHNRAGLIRRALTSVLEQSCVPDEVVIVDDGSTDDTESVVGEFGPGVTYIRQANAGAAAARNTGVANAHGDFIAFLDSDDHWLPGHLARLAEAHQATNGGAVLYFDDCYFSAPGLSDDSNRRLWDLANFEPHAPFEVSEDPFPWAMMALQPTMLQCSLIKTAAYRDIGGLRPQLRLRHDTALFFSLARAGSWCAVQHVGTRMTPEADNRLTSALPSSSREYWMETVEMYSSVARASETRADHELAEIRSRLSTAYWRLARIAGQEHRILDAARGVVRSLTSSPRSFARRLVPPW